MKSFTTPFLLFALSFFCFSGYAQESMIGSSGITNFRQQEYLGGTQTWDVAAVPGKVFFANNDGLLIFNGNDFGNWPLPNRTIVRSLLFVDDKVYAGGQNEFGFFRQQTDGHWQYQSLSVQLPADTRDQLADIWSIDTFNNQVIFQSNHHILFTAADSIVQVYHSTPSIIKAGRPAAGYYWFDDQQRMYAWSAEGPVDIPITSPFVPFTPTSIVGWQQDSFLIGTNNHGILLYTNGKIDTWKPELGFLKQARVYAMSYHEDLLVIGTSRDGLFEYHTSTGLVRQYAQEQGMQKNNVLSVAIDPFGNIWAGLDRGIDFIARSNPFRYLYPDGSYRGTGYAALQLDNGWLLGTNSGLYESGLSGRDFRSIPGTEGQVWSLQQIIGQVLLSHHEGLFQRLPNGTFRKISPGMGSWKIMAIPGTSLLLEGTYEGMNLYRMEVGGNIRHVQHIGDFRESSRFFAIDDRTIWVAHPYKGLYKLQVDDNWNLISLQVYNAKNGFPDDLNIQVFPLRNEVVFTGNSGIYQYQPSLDSFVAHPEFSRYFEQDERLMLLTEGPNNDIWFITNRNIGFLDIRETSLTKDIRKVTLPKLPERLTQIFEFILPTVTQILLAAEEGFIVVDREGLQDFSLQAPAIQIGSVYALGTSDSLLTPAMGATIELPNDFKGVHFHLSFLNYAVKDLASLQYKLEGFDRDWSDWTTATVLPYNFLEPGTYKLWVRSRTMEESSEFLVATIRISQPWFQTRYALLTLFLALLAAITIVYVVSSIRLKGEKRKMELTKVREIRAKEQQFQSRYAQTQEEIDKLKADNLQKELEFQNKELANATMHLVQRGEMLQRVKDKLSEVVKLVKDPTAKKQIGALIRVIENDENFESTWQSLERQFDRVHINFTQRLKETYPLLTPNDIKLCTYLKMNLTSKEIASLTNISVRGVEISRYRLRKKLNLDGNENLVEYIQQI